MDLQFYSFPLINAYLIFYLLFRIMFRKLQIDLIRTKAGPIGNRHVADHVACNFHATHPYSIYVIEYVGVMTMEGLVTFGCDESRHDLMLI